MMASGGPGDEPLLDILYWKVLVYSPQIDGLITDIVRFGWGKELKAKFNLFQPPPDFEAQLQVMCAKRKKETQESGWELDWPMV